MLLIVFFNNTILKMGTFWKQTFLNNGLKKKKIGLFDGFLIDFCLK